MGRCKLSSATNHEGIWLQDLFQNCHNGTGYSIIVGYAFVDDTDLIQTAHQPTETIESVIQEMQKGMDLWEGLISATGGALSVEKCRWWAIDFLWNDDWTWRFKTVEEAPGNLYAVDFDGTRQTIERLDILTAFETLGVFLAPDGNQKAAVEKLMDKANEWADKLRTSHLCEQETATALKATILKTLEYPLLTLHLSEEECNKIMRPILHAALPKAKFNRHFCRRTIYGPGSHLGAEIHKLHTSQILSHVDSILRHGPNDSLTGTLLRGSIEAAKVELGFSGDLFSHRFKEYGHLITDRWVKRTWNELDKAKIEVIECTNHLLPQREHDIFVMECFRQVRFKGIDLERLNRCRLYLRIYSLADICKADGRYLLLQYLDGINPMPQRSSLAWPNQGTPNPTIWRLWKRAIKLAFPHDRTGKLFIHRHEVRARTDGTHQFGGTGVCVLGKDHHNCDTRGQDPSGLGRWTWTHLRGREGNGIVFISAYRSNGEGADGEGAGTSTVWSQHRTYLMGQEDSREPRQAFLQDLKSAIRQWKESGDHIILGMDANDDLRNGTVKSALAAIGLHEIILCRHYDKPTQATYNRNKSNKPIDGIFVSSEVRVSGCGYYGWDESVPSTHRALWLDIPRDLLGTEQESLSSPARRLKNDDPRVVKTYVHLAEAGYHKFDLHQQFHQLHQEICCRSRMSKRQLRRRDWLQAKVISIRKEAEKKCKKLKKGKVRWSPALQLLRDRLEVWRLLVIQAKGCQISSRRLRRYLKKAALGKVWRLPLPDLIECQKKAMKKYKKAKKKAGSLYDLHLHDLLQALADKNGSTVHRERRKRLQCIRQKEEASRIRTARGKSRSGKGLQMIDVPTGTRLVDGKEVTMYTRRNTKDTVEDGCIVENEARFSQTYSPYCTPPMREPLFSLFSRKDAERHSREILTGTFDVSVVADPYLRAFLAHCRSIPGLKQLPEGLSLDSHKQFWKKMTETKSSEPHGLHNGHYKAALESSLLTECDFWSRDIPYRTGVAPAIYRHLLDFEIEKSPGVYNIDKMRTIELMNTELNTNNKTLARDGMYNAEDATGIPCGQYGSRKKHRASDLALCKRLTWDWLILTRTAAGWCSNDAKSCFDWIVHWIATICLLRFGLPWAPIRSLFRTMQTAVHRLRTGFGDSERTFKSPFDVPFQGCGQGNGAGPAMWVAISTVLMGMMESEGIGLQALSPISKLHIVATCFSFVDDTDVVHAASDPHTSSTTILPRIQNAVDTWTGGVNATGGAVRPDKSFWCLIDHIWVPAQARWKLATSKDIPAEVTIQSLDGGREALSRVEASDAKETLGIFMAVDGNEKEEVANLLSKTRKWAEAVRTGFLKRTDVLRAVKTTMQKTVEYPMAVISLSKEQWEKIMSPVRQAALPKAGICRNLALPAVYGPLKYQGLGLDHPYGLQVLAHVVAALRHGPSSSNPANPSSSTLTGQFLRQDLELHQLEIGLPWGVFQNHYDDVGCLASDTWVKRCWEELHSLDMHLAYKGPDLEPQRLYDSYIMQHFIDQGYYGTELQRLNWCRIHLQAVTVSDLASADGRRILTSSWNGSRDPCRKSVYAWPRSKKPPELWWELWRRALGPLMEDSGGRIGHNSSLHLLQPLGD